MHAPGKGICTFTYISPVHLLIRHPASSALPYRRAPPSWLKTTPEEVVEHIIKLARKGLTPSQIGVALRDSHGIPQVRFVTGNKILRILKSQGTLPHLPLLSQLMHYLFTLFPSYLHPLLVMHAALPFCLGIGLGPSIPEDLWHLIKKAVAVRKHMETNRKDRDSKFRLILIESRIHRLARYYKTKQQIAPTFKYDAATASTLVA
jgi:small subunit ribosomal protein S13e